jgi:hypothetical protein
MVVTPYLVLVNKLLQSPLRKTYYRNLEICDNKKKTTTKGSLVIEFF